MISMLLVLAGQTLAAPPAAPASPPNKPPSIYALVFVAKRPAWETRSSRKDQLVDEAAWVRYFSDVNYAVLRADTVSRLKVVEKLKKDGGRREARNWLREFLRVESLEDTGVLRISFAAGSPREQVVIANAVAKAYIQMAGDFRRERYESIIADCSKECANAKVAIRGAELEIAKLDGMIAKDMNEAERIARNRNTLTERITFMKEKIEKRQPEIRKRQEALRNPHSILLELAEMPPESK